MKNSLLCLLGLGFIFFYNNAQACSCDSNSAPLDDESAVIKVARMKAALGRGGQVKAEEIEAIKSYPNLFERLNLDSFKGTSCEVHGPNGESHHYCSGSAKIDYKVVVFNSNTTCTIIVRAKSDRHSVSARAISKICE